MRDAACFYLPNMDLIKWEGIFMSHATNEKSAAIHILATTFATANFFHDMD